jgi:hypothetical protein
VYSLCVGPFSRRVVSSVRLSSVSVSVRRLILPLLKVQCMTCEGHQSIFGGPSVCVGFSVSGLDGEILMGLVESAAVLRFVFSHK